MISVLNYGAVGNGIADDTTAIRNAIAAVGATGGMVSFPAGTYKISGTLTISSANVTLVGEGIGATRIVSTSTTGDLIKFFATPSFTGGGVKDMTLDFSGTATAGAAIRIDGQRLISLENLWILRPFQGVVLEGDNRTCRLRNVDISDHLGNAFTVNGGGNQYFDNCTTYNNVAGGGTAAFLVTQAEGVWLDKCVSQRASYGLRVTPAASQYVLDLWIDACDFDSSISDGVVFDSGASGRITTVNWNGSRIGFGNARGLVIDGSHTQNLQFSNLRSEKNLGHGMVIGNVLGAQFANASFLGNAALGAANTFGANIIGGTGVVFTGGRSGAYSDDGNNQKYGIVFGATFTGDALVCGTDLRGNQTAGAFNGSGPGVLFRDCLGF
ncbi:glycosyl hydrolase family 28-related protein [Sphingomonas sp. ERG5]|uniref:glycosyl hydrolase family 28-related protein n=1 Tax=Sphingomonas sp. ERG5 TaxID=1381597 RepID=UPI00054C416E|nr:glycosyl hydrolase family 28-related protein [Sphingomonas sp. ERG5]